MSPESSSIQPSPIVFLLGAGASVEAGVPDTYGFVGKSRASLRGHLQSALDEVLAGLGKGSEGEVDIELLLATLSHLEQLPVDPTSRFLSAPTLRADTLHSLPALVSKLKDFIKLRAVVAETDVRYLHPFREFVLNHAPLDVISMNYDICIEQLSNSLRLSCRDGFDVFWDSSSFAKDDTDIRLYKLHGSATWYRTDRGSYVKLPVMATGSRLRLITGEMAEALMLYPMRKLSYAEPLLELLVTVKKLLEAPQCRVLVVVGYSFRDEDIRQILWDAAQRNKQLLVVLVDPKGLDVYRKRLKYYDAEGKRPSSLSGRVVCLPYRCGLALYWLKNRFLKHLLDGHEAERAQELRVSEGHRHNWSDAVMHYAEAQFVERVEELIERPGGTWIDTTPAGLPQRMQVSLKLGVNLALNGDARGAQLYLDDFVRSLRAFMIDEIASSATRDPYTVRLLFPAGSAAQVYEVIAPLNQYLGDSVAYVSSPPPILRRIDQRLSNFVTEYFSVTARHDPIPLEDYFTARQRHTRAMKTLRSLAERAKKGYTPELFREIEQLVTNVEKTELGRLLPRPLAPVPDDAPDYVRYAWWGRGQD